jgi:hypothetical protein
MLSPADDVVVHGCVRTLPRLTDFYCKRFRIDVWRSSDPYPYPTLMTSTSIPCEGMDCKLPTTGNTKHVYSDLLFGHQSLPMSFLRATMASPYLSGVITVVLVYVFIWISRSHRRVPLPPGPTRLPIIGNLVRPRLHIL